jgi:hypothetical protein
MGTAAEHHRVPVEIDDLRDPQPRLHGQQQQSVIAPSQQCATIRAGQDRVNLGSAEKLKLAFVASLARDREHALNVGAIRRLLERRISEEGIGLVRHLVGTVQMPELAGSNVVLIGSGISVNALILSFGAGLLVGILYRVPALILLNAATLAAIAIFAVALGWSFGYMRKRFPNTLLPKLI